MELLTFGHPERGRVRHDLFPFDIAFDPSKGSVEELLGLCPPGWTPDILLFFYPEQEPLPSGLESSPVPVVGVISDWNLHFEQLWSLGCLFDTIAADRVGTRIFNRAGFKDTFYWPQYTFRAQWNYPRPGLDRDIDVFFAGNLNPEIQGERAPWLARLAALRGRARVELATGVYNEDYGLLLARSRIGFNRSVRGEMNLRAFEVCASQALLFMEDSNHEVREFLVPEREVVLYGDDDLEKKLFWFLEHEDERAAIASAGRLKILDYSMGRNLDRLRSSLAGLNRPGLSQREEWRCHLARGLAMCRTWAAPETTLAELLRCARLAPQCAEVRNAIGSILASFWPQVAGGEALGEFRAAARLDPDYVPAVFNLAFLTEASGRPQEADALWEEVAHRAERARSFPALRGLLLPMRFGAWENRMRAEAALSVLADEPERLGSAFISLAAQRPGRVPALAPQSVTSSVEPGLGAKGR